MVVSARVTIPRTWIGSGAVERHEVEVLLVLGEELHFGRAADRLRVSPSRVSRTLQSVERRIGAPLFERSSRQVALTPIGRRLLEELRPGCDQIQQAVRQAVRAGRGIEGVLSIGFGSPGAGRMILAVAQRFRVDHPGVEVRIRELHMSDGVTGWRSDRYDMVLIGRPVCEPEFVTGPVLISEARMLAVSARHPLAAQESISTEDLAAVGLFRMPGSLPAAMVEDRAPRQTPGGRPIANCGVAYSGEEILTRVGAGEGAFILGAQAIRYHPRPDVVYLPIEDAPPIERGFAWRACRETACVRAFNAAAVKVGVSQLL